jgi:hypothetical protein
VAVDVLIAESIDHMWALEMEAERTIFEKHRSVAYSQ